MKKLSKSDEELKKICRINQFEFEPKQSLFERIDHWLCLKLFPDDFIPNTKSFGGDTARKINEIVNPNYFHKTIYELSNGWKTEAFLGIWRDAVHLRNCTNGSVSMSFYPIEHMLDLWDFAEWDEVIPNRFMNKRTEEILDLQLLKLYIGRKEHNIKTHSTHC